MLTAHITSSVGWTGALIVFLAHAVAGVISQEEQIVRATSLAMGITAWFVILPLSFASLITGIVQSLGTAWGLFRHYWILFKLLLTVIATFVLLLNLEPISFLSDMATAETFSSTDFIGLQTSLMVHAVGGLLVLLSATVLAVYKPTGITRYWLRKKHKKDNSELKANFEGVASTPRWVKVFAFFIVLLILIVGIMMLVGSHGPDSHM